MENTFNLKKFLAEGKLLKEDTLKEEITSDVEEYLVFNFEVYLDGGDDFEEEPGEIHTYIMEKDNFGDPEYYDDADLFKKAVEQLNNSPFIFNDTSGYGKVNFKTDGNNIIISFIVPELDNY